MFVSRSHKHIPLHISYTRTIPEAPQILSLNPLLSSLSPFPRSLTHQLPWLFPYHHYYFYYRSSLLPLLLPRTCPITVPVSVFVPGVICLNKSCLPLVLSIAVAAGGSANSKALA